MLTSTHSDATMLFDARPNSAFTIDATWHLLDVHAANEKLGHSLTKLKRCRYAKT